MKKTDAPEQQEEEAAPTRTPAKFAPSVQESALLIGARGKKKGPKAQVKQEERREELLASGDARALYQFELAQRKAARAPTRSAEEALIDSTRERLKAEQEEGTFSVANARRRADLARFRRTNTPHSEQES